MQATKKMLGIGAQNKAYDYLNKKPKMQGFEYKKKESSPLKEEGEMYISNDRSSMMSIPDENFEYEIEEIDAVDAETYYFNRSSKDESRVKENLTKDKSKKNPVKNNTKSKVSPLRSFEAFTKAKNDLGGRNSPKVANNLTARSIPNFYQNSKENHSYEFFIFIKMSQDWQNKKAIEVSKRLHSGRIGSGKSEERSK